MSNCKTQSRPALSAGKPSSPSNRTESIAERPGFSLSGEPWSPIAQDSPATPADRPHPDGQKENTQNHRRQRDAHPQRKGRPKRLPTQRQRGSTLTADTVTKPVLHPFFVAERAPRRMGPVSVLLSFRRVHDALTTPGLFPLRSGGKEQSQQLQSIDITGFLGDPSGIAVQAVALDFDLLRYACYFVERKFEEAARHDCARLIVESVLDQRGGEASGEHWRRWLSVAPCWPQLAIACWSSVLREVPDLLIERLTASGLVIDREMNQGIEELVSGLTIADVLPAALVAQFFGEGEDGGDDDAAGDN